MDTKQPSDIRWRFQGEAYELARGSQRRLVASPLWWSTVRSARPTHDELERLWNLASPDRDRDSDAQQQEQLQATRAELEQYLSELRAEVTRLDSQVAAGELPLALLEHHRVLLDAAQAQLEHLRAEQRQTYD